jgi:eukaryotic-like serine/threonine-protein kinase
MPIQLGQRLGPYEILSAIGAGGMGEVYRARDGRLNRDVALKILPEVFAADPDRMARFEREARVLGALNHPNIAAIYGLEEFGSSRALVMELVEGETLADRIARGPIPLDEALPIAKQIAEALEYAHDHGVIHRDLKPANIKVTPDGTVKVLDFGLAKALMDEPVAADPRDSPTLSMAPTMTGVILGTAAYMSPEQAKGKPVDRRADIWAFGVVLFEMLAGKPLYSGETAAETLAAVMMKEPVLEALPKDTAPAIQNLLRRCLEKNPQQRLQHIGEARIVIGGILSAGAPAVQPVAAQRQQHNFTPFVAALATVLLVALAGTYFFIHFRQTRPQERSIRFEIAPPERTTLSMFRLSPDGRYLAFTALGGGRNQLWLRSLDSLQAQALQGTDDPSYPFWSPDSSYIGFFAQGKLKKISVTGGPPQTLCDAPAGRGATWNNDGVILFAPNLTGGLYRVSAAGGVP